MGILVVLHANTNPPAGGTPEAWLFIHALRTTPTRVNAAKHSAMIKTNTMKARRGTGTPLAHDSQMVASYPLVFHSLSIQCQQFFHTMPPVIHIE
jgi:hypothetical protein